MPSDNVTVKWREVNAISISGSRGTANATYSELYDQTLQKSVLNFGAVQAGRVTDVKCIVATFSQATTISDIQFWLDSDQANMTGSQNIDLSGDSWEFYYSVIPKNLIPFAFANSGDNKTNFSENQKKGATTIEEGVSTVHYLGGSYKMEIVPRTVELAGASNKFNDVEITIPSGSSGDSPYIFLSVQTDSNAHSGNTAGWFYRMNFLYS